MVDIIRGGDIPTRTLKPIRVAGYFRLTADSSKADAVRLLRRAIQNRIDKSEAWIYAGAYFDRDSTEADYNPHMAFDKMMSEARAGNIDLLLTDTIEHFTPTAEDTIRFVEELRSLPTPVRIIFLKDGVDSETVHAVVPIVRGWRP